MQELLDKPSPIIFAVVQGVQQLANGTFNLLAIFDKAIIYRLPDGTQPDTVTIQVVVVWTGGQGKFEQVIRLLDEDGTELGNVHAQFELASTTARHYQVSLINLPVREGPITLTIARVGAGEEELLRQDFTIEVQAFPGAPQ